VIFRDVSVIQVLESVGHEIYKGDWLLRLILALRVQCIAEDREVKCHANRRTERKSAMQIGGQRGKVPCK
jgi:hypothetical protein